MPDVIVALIGIASDVVAALVTGRKAFIGSENVDVLEVIMEHAGKERPRPARGADANEVPAVARR